MLKKIFTFSQLTLLVALSLSSVAAYYSIIGLTAIFAGAVVPVIIMGSILEVGKITTTVWLRKYWKRAGWMLKLYLVPAVIALALLTSMGIFGFLSKAHMEQGITSGDAGSKVALFDEKISIQRENIKSDRAMLAQMDTQVNDIMSKGDSERSVERSVAIRKQQAPERAKILKSIEASNKEIQSLNEQRAPLASELRKIEAEVGPIKYIAALIYGDNADANMLEAAVRWVIILLVVVFDPLAIALVLAANASKEWDLEEEPKIEVPVNEYRDDDDEVFEDGYKTDFPEIVEEPIIEEVKKPVEEEPIAEILVIEPTVEEDEAFSKIESTTVELLVPELSIEEQMADTVDTEIVAIPQFASFEGIKDPVTKEWIQTGPVFEPKTSSSFKDVGDGYVEFEGKKMSKRVLQSLRPDLFNLKEDNPREIEIGFGSSLPSAAKMGDTFIKIDTMPHVVYKNNGSKWIEINKQATGAYLGNVAYLHHLMEKISTGEYDPELLTDYEQEAITNHIKVN